MKRNPTLSLTLLPEVPQDKTYVASMQARKAQKLAPQIIPIIVTEDDGKYHIYDGLRRVAALRLIGHNSVDAYVATKGTDFISDEDLHALTIAINNLRSQNVASEAVAVEHLLNAGWTETTIHERTGIPLLKVRGLIKLKKNLVPEAFQKLKDGKLAESTAKRVARLPEKEQQRVVAEKRITKKDADAAVRHHEQSMLNVENIQTPIISLNEDLAAQVDAFAQKLSGKNRQTLIDAAHIIRKTSK